MSRPPVNPEKSTAGISLDPITLERVIPESRRADGSVRKQIKIRPGFTPQEDVRRFRGTKQAQMDANTLPKGHVIGWAPPPKSTAASSSDATAPLSKSAKKNAKRKEKREKEKTEKVEAVPDNWDDDDDGEGTAASASTASANAADKSSDKAVSSAASKNKETPDPPVDDLSGELEKLDVK